MICHCCSPFLRGWARARADGKPLTANRVGARAPAQSANKRRAPAYKLRNTKPGAKRSAAAHANTSGANKPPSPSHSHPRQARGQTQKPHARASLSKCGGEYMLLSLFFSLRNYTARWGRAPHTAKQPEYLTADLHNDLPDCLDWIFNLSSDWFIHSFLFIYCNKVRQSISIELGSLYQPLFFINEHMHLIIAAAPSAKNQAASCKCTQDGSFLWRFLWRRTLLGSQFHQLTAPLYYFFQVIGSWWR